MPPGQGEGLDEKRQQSCQPTALVCWRLAIHQMEDRSRIVSVQCRERLSDHYWCFHIEGQHRYAASLRAARYHTTGFRKSRCHTPGGRSTGDSRPPFGKAICAEVNSTPMWRPLLCGAT